MELSPSTQERIFQAADALYDESGRHTFPIVDAVRKYAKVNMNDASTGMKAWRKAQGLNIIPIEVQVPGALQQSSANALSALWTEAMRLANETLRAAEAGWNSERAESDALREQMADAFEKQATELESLQTVVAQLHAEVERVKLDKTDLQRQRDMTHQSLSTAETSAQRSEARAIEIQRRADDLRIELDYCHSASEALKKEIADVRQARQDDHAGFQKELTAVRAEAEENRMALQIELARAREDAAGLRGQIEILQQKSPPQKNKTRPRKEAGQSSPQLFPSTEACQHADKAP